MKAALFFLLGSTNSINLANTHKGQCKSNNNLIHIDISKPQREKRPAHYNFL